MTHVDIRRDSLAKTREERFRMLVDQIVDYAIFILDATGHVATWNAGAERMKGYSASEVIGSHASTFYVPQDAWKCARALEAAVREGPVEDEGWRVRKDGSLFWANVVITALRDSQGRVVGFGNVTRDLTERRKAEEALRQSEERSRLLVGSVSDYAIFMLDPRGMVATWNRGAERTDGYRAEEIIGQHFSRFYPEEAVRAGACERELEAAARDGRFEDDGWRVRKDGSSFLAHVIITALYDSRGELLGFAKVTQDVTDRRRADGERVRLAEVAAARASAEREAGFFKRMHQVASSLAVARTPEEVARAIVEQGVETLRASSGAFFRRGGVDMELLSSHRADDRADDGWVDASTTAFVGAAYRSAEPEWVEELPEAQEGDPRRQPVAPSSAVALPLVLGGRVLGVAAFRFERPLALAHEERAFLQAIVTYAAQAFDRAEAYAQEVATRRRVEALSDLSEALSKSLTPTDVVQAVMDHVMEVARANICAVYAVDDRTGALDLLGERGGASSIVQRLRRITAESENPIDRTISTGESVWFELSGDGADLSPALAKPQAEEPRAHAFWSVPLRAEARTIGLLGIGFYGPRRSSRAERDFVGTVARQSAEALLRAQRLERQYAARVHAEELQASLSTTLRSIGDAVIATDREARVTFMNPVAERLTGWSESEAHALGVDQVLRIVSDESGASAGRPIGMALRTGESVCLADHTLLRSRFGSETPIAANASPIRTREGTLLGAVLVFRDVTEQKTRRLRRELLAKAGEAFASSLDYRTTLETIARLMVPDLADWCAVDVVEPGATVPKQVAVAHRDPGQEQKAREDRERYLSTRALRTGRSPNVDLYAEMLEASASDAVLRSIIHEMRIESAIVVPLTGRGQVIGALTFIYAGSGRRYTDSDKAFAEDFARRAAMAIENARALRDVKHAVRAREDLLAMVSHDLRNPLSTVLMAARIIQQRADQSDSGARTAKAAGNIVKAVGRMSRLVADLLDLAKLEAGKPLAIETEKMDMGDLIREAVELFAPSVSTRLLTLTTEVSAPARAECDGQRMLQVLSNLIDNAIKHTREGGAIQVGARTTEGEVVLWVRDTGTGISEEQSRHIFEPYWQANEQRKGGLGLGLPIVRAIAAAHSGRVWVESATGVGSTFYFALPICDDAARG